jgi:hypothetical protein
MPTAARDYAEVLLRLLRGTKLSTSGCWEWGGAKSSSGYGRIGFDGARWACHRLMAHIKVGAVKPDDIVCHRCDNPCCINPEHLFIGTQKQNVDDRDAKGRRNQVRGARQGSSKLTEDMVKAIRLDTRKPSIIADEYGISRAHVGNLKHNRAWKHV